MNRRQMIAGVGAVAAATVAAPLVPGVGSIAMGVDVGSGSTSVRWVAQLIRQEWVYMPTGETISEADAFDVNTLAAIDAARAT